MENFCNIMNVELECEGGLQGDMANQQKQGFTPAGDGLEVELEAGLESEKQQGTWG